MKNISSFINHLLSGREFQNGKMNISRREFDDLKKRYGVSVSDLADSGIKIEISDPVSIKILDIPINMGDVIKAIDATSFFKKAKYLFSVSSTNDFAKELIEKEEDELDGLVLVAEHQTAGRGRFKRKWFSRGFMGIYTTFLLRPFFPIEKLQLITLITGLSVKKTLMDINPEFERSLDIKWPNDVLIGGKKVCGILTETISRGNGIEYVIIGVGINVNQNEFEPQIERFATSLFKESGRKFDRTVILVKLLNYINFYFEGLKNGKFSHLISEWERESSYAYRKKIKYFEKAKPIMGTTDGLDENGYLKIKLSGGGTTKIMSGEIFEF